MSETLITELLRYCKTSYGVDLTKWSSARDLLTAELCLLKSLVRLGRAAMQRWCEQLGDGYVGSRVTHNDVRYRFVGKRKKVIHGLFGLISYVRAYYAPLGGRGKGWTPRAEHLGIGGGYTPGCQYFMARFSAEQPYEQGLEQFHEVFRPDERELVSMGKAFEMVRKVGDGVAGQRRIPQPANQHFRSAPCDDAGVVGKSGAGDTVSAFCWTRASHAATAALGCPVHRGGPPSYHFAWWDAPQEATWRSRTPGGRYGRLIPRFGPLRCTPCGP